MDFSLPAPYDHGILQARILEWGCRAFLQGTFPTQRSNLRLLRLLRCRRILYPWATREVLRVWALIEAQSLGQASRDHGSSLSCLLDSVTLPSSCCITFISKKIPESRVISYQLTNRSICPQAGVMWVTITQEGSGERWASRPTEGPALWSRTGHPTPLNLSFLTVRLARGFRVDHYEYTRQPLGHIFVVAV